MKTNYFIYKAVCLILIAICYVNIGFTEVKADTYDIITADDEYMFIDNAQYLCVYPMCAFETASDYNQLITQTEMMQLYHGTPDGKSYQAYINSLAFHVMVNFTGYWWNNIYDERDVEEAYMAQILSDMENPSTNITIWMANVAWDEIPEGKISVDDPELNFQQVYYRERWNWKQAREQDPHYKDNPLEYYEDKQWATLPFDNSFRYTGGALLIKICHEAAEKPDDFWNSLPFNSYGGYFPGLMFYGGDYYSAPQMAGKAYNVHADAINVYSSSTTVNCEYDYDIWDYVCDTIDFNWGSDVGCGSDWTELYSDDFMDLIDGATPKMLVHQIDWGDHRFDFRLDMDVMPSVQLLPADQSVFLSTTTENKDIPNITTPGIDFCCAGSPFFSNYEISYRILNSRRNEVFRALDPVTGEDWITINPANATPKEDGSFTFYFARAIGSMVEMSIDNRAQLSFKSDNLGDNYTAELEIRFLDEATGEYITDKQTSTIIARYPDNIELISIAQPPDNQLYSISDDAILFEVNYMNTGLLPLSDYSINYHVSYVERTIVNGEEVSSYIPIFDTTCYLDNAVLAAGAERSHRLESFIPNTIPNIETGNYALDVRIYVGQDSTNRNIGNSLRRSFRLTNSYDGSVDAVLFPSADDALYTHQAYYPQIRISNRAALPASTLTLSVICQPVNSTDTVYHSTELVLGLPAWEEYVDDNGNLVPLESVYRDVTLSRPMVLKESGSYRLTISLDTTEDHDLSNNVYTYIFTTQPSLSGTYYIGDNTSSNYGSLNDAVTGLYNRGMDDSVRFVLGSGLHRLGSAMSEYGLDLTSSIGGIDTNKPGTISIVTDPNNTERGSVTLEFSSRSGVGLYVASSTTSPYTSAPINQFTGSVNDPYGERKKDYDRFNAKLIIDGGANKALRIRMSDVLGRAVGAGNRVPIVLGRGVQNVIIRNCIIETDAVSLPRVPGVLYSAKFNNFSFRPLESVSAGILIRNELPVDRFGRNDLGIDTVLNSNILIENCEFIGGSYGVISTGIGPLYEHSTGSYVGYYNRDNVIRNNVFTGQQVAGVFLGYEQGSVVEGNVISGVNSGSYTGDAGGIILGGMGDPAVKSLGGTTGYNNFNITLNRNDINDITSNNGAAYGIKVEQTMNDFSYSHLMGNKYFTNHNDSIKIYNNAIWDINSDTEVYGIRLFGSRDTAGQSDKFVRFTDRLSSLLYLSHASIANNTVVLVPLLEHTVSTYFGGIVLQDVDTLQFYNNAISIKAPLNAPITSEIFSPLVLQSVNPSNAQVSFLMDNNIYYSRPNADNIVRFIEQDDMVPDSLLLEGLGMEYRGMDQWRRLSGAEDLSSIYDFSNILTVNTFSIPASGSSEYNYTRLGLSALSSSGLGTALNNRGRRLPFVTTDITGLPRGYATQLYDIGAWEFNSTQHDDDCEVLGFVAPLSLRSSVSPYDDAEYVMAPSKIELAVRVRNNGTSSVQERPLRLLVERQLQNGSYSEVVELTKKFSLSTGETTVVDFSDQIAALSGNSVFPRSYEDLRQNLNSRELRFSFMRNNVTPIYRYTVDVSSAGDRESNNDVNQTGKLVRYYLKKSKVSAILSVQNTMLVPPTSASNYVDWLSSRKESLIAANGEQSVLDSVSSYLNYRSLVDGFSAIGFSVDSLDYDLFDRHAWEPSSVNYANYRYMFWSDGHDSRLSSNQIRDLNLFMHDGHNLRKSIVMASEELARHTYQSVVSTPRQGQDLINIIFGTKIKGTGFYSASQGDTLRLSGNALAPNLSLFLSQTPLYLDHDLDNGYSPAIFESYGSNPSLSSRQAFYYADPLSVASIEKTFGLVSFSPNQHCVYLGADWRNFSDVSLLLESILSSMGGFLTDDASLPVELISFDASALNGAVLLDWSTSSEAHSREYVVEKLFGSTFEPIHKELANNSQRLANHYSATDMDVSAGNTYTYRLRTLSVDGSVSYSSERSVLLAGSDLVVSLGVPSPSPASSDLTINYSLSLPSSVRLTVYDLSGSAVLSLRSGGVLAAGSYTESYSVSDLPSGTYNLVLECGGVVKMQRFVVSR